VFVAVLVMAVGIVRMLMDVVPVVADVPVVVSARGVDVAVRVALTVRAGARAVVQGNTRGSATTRPPVAIVEIEPRHLYFDLGAVDLPGGPVLILGSLHGLLEFIDPALQRLHGAPVHIRSGREALAKMSRSSCSVILATPLADTAIDSTRRLFSNLSKRRRTLRTGPPLGSRPGCEPRPQEVLDGLSPCGCPECSS